MSEHVYKIIELVGSSPTSIEDAISGAIARACDTVDNIDTTVLDQMADAAADALATYALYDFATE